MSERELVARGGGGTRKVHTRPRSQFPANSNSSSRDVRSRSPGGGNPHHSHDVRSTRPHPHSAQQQQQQPTIRRVPSHRRAKSAVTASTMRKPSFNARSPPRERREQLQNSPSDRSGGGGGDRSHHRQTQSAKIPRNNSRYVSPTQAMLSRVCCMTLVLSRCVRVHAVVTFARAPLAVRRLRHRHGITDEASRRAGAAGVCSHGSSPSRRGRRASHAPSLPMVVRASRSEIHALRAGRSR